MVKPIKEMLDNNKMKNLPIQINYFLYPLGLVAENTKAARLKHQIWENDINSKDVSSQVVVSPKSHVSGKFIYPYSVV